jgi:TonB family protein
MDVPSPQRTDTERQDVSPASSKPNLAGLTSRAQQNEMRVILARKWPAMRPLPVFKYETAGYRAAIEFDKLRGEWVCRKITFPSNAIQELRGGLTELTMALPPEPVNEFPDDPRAEHREEESEKDATRRMQAMLEWKSKQESGVAYSELENYLSKGQREEVYEIVRLTLTARQLQFLPKNVAQIFESLSKAGGRLAGLVEIAQRNQAGQSCMQGPDRDLALEACKMIVLESAEEFPAPPTENLISAPPEELPREPVAVNFFEQDQKSLPDVITPLACEESEIVARVNLDTSPLPVVEEAHERPRRRVPFAGFGAQISAAKAEPTGERSASARSRLYVLEISGVHVAALAIVILFAALSLTVGLTLGGGTLGERLRNARKSIVAADAAPPSLASSPSEIRARTSPGANKLEGKAATEEKSEGSLPDAARVAKVPDTLVSSAPAMEAQPPKPTETSGHRPTAHTPRNMPSRASLKPVYSAKATVLTSAAPRNAAPRPVTIAKDAGPHQSSGSTILVRGPGDGRKAFRVTLPEVPIGASRTFAMTAQLSVVVSPEPGLAAANQPNRLQAGEIVSFVWPSYPRPGDRSGAAETVKIRTTIGTLGQVEDVKLVSGSASLFSAAMSAIRMWHYKPTRLNERPVQAQEDVTIEFRR